MFLPTLCLSVFRFRLARYFSGHAYRANVNSRQGIVVSDATTSAVAIHRLAFTVVLQSVSGRIGLVVNGRLRRIIFYSQLFVKPMRQDNVCAIYVRRDDHSNDDVGLVSLHGRDATNVRRVGF